MLAQRATKCFRTDDYELYMSSRNDPSIPSALAYWKAHHTTFPDLAKMARDTLAVPASGCLVERMFSAAGRAATWQRFCFHDSTIADIMMYKAWLNLEFLAAELDALDEFPVEEMLGKIPKKWEQDFWKRKLRLELRSEIEAMFLEDPE